MAKGSSLWLKTSQPSLGATHMQSLAYLVSLENSVFFDNWRQILSDLFSIEPLSKSTLLHAHYSLRRDFFVHALFYIKRVFSAAAKHPGHEKFVNNNIFEKKIDENDDENDQNAVNTHGSGAESTLSSSQEKPVEEVHRGYTKAVTKPKVFNVVESVKFYEERKKHRLAEIERKEREQRKFVAKPAPKFDSIHAAANQKRSASHEKLRVTIPVTPKVVHHHRQNIEKLKTKVCLPIGYLFLNTTDEPNYF